MWLDIAIHYPVPLASSVYFSVSKIFHVSIKYIARDKNKSNQIDWRLAWFMIHNILQKMPNVIDDLSDACLFFGTYRSPKRDG